MGSLLPREGVYYIIRELRRYLENLREQINTLSGDTDSDKELTKRIREVERVISELERAIQEEDHSLFAKALLKLRTMDIAIIADDKDVKATALYSSWEKVVNEAKKGMLPRIDLKEFLELEWQRLFLGVGIIQELSQLEQDPEERELLVGTFRDAFRHYYFALDNLTNYLKTGDEKLLDQALDEIYYAAWFMLNLRELLPEEYERDLEELIKLEDGVKEGE